MVLYLPAVINTYGFVTVRLVPNQVLLSVAAQWVLPVVTVLS